MPVCCRCNASGSCKNCSCKKSNQECSNCLPLRRGHCTNTHAPAIKDSTATLPHLDTQKLFEPINDATQEAPTVSTNTLEILTPLSDTTIPESRDVFTPAILNDEQNEPTTTTTINDLPPFTQIPNPKFRWRAKDGEIFTSSITIAYEEIVHWRRNIFKVPCGKTGKSFVLELARMFRAYADSSALEGVALKAAMVMPALMLQKPHSRSKAKEPAKHLERRLQLWVKGEIESLVNEGRTIQHQFAQDCRKHRRSTQPVARTFAKLMMEGKVRAALRLIAEGNSGGPLSLDSHVESNDPNITPTTVRETLLKKHPPKQPLKQSALFISPNTQTVEPHPVIRSMDN